MRPGHAGLSAPLSRGEPGSTCHVGGGCANQPICWQAVQVGSTQLPKIVNRIVPEKFRFPCFFFTKLLDMQGLLDLMSIEKLSAWGLVKLWKPLATRPCVHFLVNVAFNAVGQSSTSTHLAMVWGSIHALQTDPAHNWPTETPDKKPDTSQSVSFDSRIAGNDSGSLWRYDKPWGFFSYVQTPFGFSD